MGTVRDEIAKNILYYRKKNGYSQVKMAELIGVTSGAISNWEKGANSIDIDTLVKVCNLFNVTLNDMYGIYCDENGFPRDPNKKSPITLKGKELSEKELIMLSLLQQIPDEKQSELLDAFEAILRISGLIE